MPQKQKMGTVKTPFNIFAHKNGMLLTFLALNNQPQDASLIYQVCLNKTEAKPFPSGGLHGFTKNDIIASRDHINEFDLSDDLNATFHRACARGKIICPIFDQSTIVSTHLLHPNDTKFVCHKNNIPSDITGWQDRIDQRKQLQKDRMSQMPQWYQKMFTPNQNNLVEHPRLISNAKI